MEEELELLIVPKTINNQSRFIVIDKNTNDIIDDAGGFGFKSEETAKTKIWYSFEGGKEKTDIKNIDNEKFCNENYLICKKIIELDTIVKDIIKITKEYSDIKDIHRAATQHLYHVLYSECLPNNYLYKYIIKNKSKILNQSEINVNNVSIPINIYNKKSIEADELANSVIKILDEKARKGSYSKKDEFWNNFKSQSGSNVGLDIEKLIKKAKYFIKNNSKE